MMVFSPMILQWLLATHGSSVSFLSTFVQLFCLLAVERDMVFGCHSLVLYICIFLSVVEMCSLGNCFYELQEKCEVLWGWRFAGSNFLMYMNLHKLQTVKIFRIITSLTLHVNLMLSIKYMNFLKCMWSQLLDSMLFVVEGFLLQIIIGSETWFLFYEDFQKGKPISCRFTFTSGDLTQSY